MPYSSRASLSSSAHHSLYDNQFHSLLVAHPARLDDAGNLIREPRFERCQYTPSNFMTKGNHMLQTPALSIVTPPRHPIESPDEPQLVIVVLRFVEAARVRPVIGVGGSPATGPPLFRAD